jgi:hypothetical protein
MVSPFSKLTSIFSVEHLITLSLITIKLRLSIDLTFVGDPWLKYIRLESSKTEEAKVIKVNLT